MVEQDAVRDSRLHRRCEHLANRMRHTRCLWCWLISSVIWKHNVTHATGSTQRRNAIVPRGRLPAYRWLRTALSSLGWRQCPHCSADQHSAWRQELFGGGPESMEQSSRHTATTRRRTLTVQMSFWDIFVLRGCSALVTLSAFNALCINLLTYSLTHSQRIALPSEEDRPWSQITCTENLWKFRRVVLEIYERKNGETER